MGIKAIIIHSAVDFGCGKERSVRSSTIIDLESPHPSLSQGSHAREDFSRVRGYDLGALDCKLLSMRILLANIEEELVCDSCFSSGVSCLIIGTGDVLKRVCSSFSNMGIV